MREVFSIAILTLCCVCASCDDRVVDIIGFEDGGSEEVSDVVEAVVQVQQPFDAEPTYLKFDFFDSPPPAPPPDYLGPTIPVSDVNFEEAYLAKAVQPLDLEGDYYVMVTLYVEGGSAPNELPTQNVDYHGWTSEPYTFGPGTGIVHVGDVVLDLVLPPQ